MYVLRSLLTIRVPHLVPRKILRRPHIRRREDLAILRNLNILPRAYPRRPSSIRKLTTFGSATVSEFVNSIIKGNNHSRPRSIERNEARFLIPASGADEAGVFSPDSDYSADGPVVVDD